MPSKKKGFKPPGKGKAGKKKVAPPDPVYASPELKFLGGIRMKFSLGGMKCGFFKQSSGQADNLCTNCGRCATVHELVVFPPGKVASPLAGLTLVFNLLSKARQCLSVLRSPYWALGLCEGIKQNWGLSMGALVEKAPEKALMAMVLQSF